MKKLSFTLGAMLLLVLMILPLLVALTTARAGMVQAQVNAAQATVNTVQSVTTLFSQCLAGMMVFMALVGGVVMGYGLHAWRFSLQKIPASLRQRGTGRKWLPGPHARWERFSDTPAVRPTSPDLSHGPLSTFSPPAPTASPRALTIADLETNAAGEEDFFDSHWGF